MPIKSVVVNICRDEWLRLSDDRRATMLADPSIDVAMWPTRREALTARLQIDGATFDRKLDELADAACRGRSGRSPSQAVHGNGAAVRSTLDIDGT